MTSPDATSSLLPTASDAALQAEIAHEAARRRTFAIISHPDAGKTTLTEKLLLYGGAIHLAGAVKARRAERHATSDWMKIEQERGISVTSSVLQFDYQGFRINLLDTPGHADFSEDTFRTLVAADSAVMLLDNRKGVEERTRQLFEVCHKRRTPIFTFVNKCDRAGEDPLKLLDDVERDLGIRCHPVTWPIFRDSGFVGVYDRLTGEVNLFERSEKKGGRADTLIGGVESAEIAEVLGPEAHDKLREDVELIDGVNGAFDYKEFLAGTLSPTFFGSALTNFGVEPFLREFVQLAVPPGPRATTEGERGPEDAGFAGFVFKIQANMDPKHRDRMAFVRVVSGKYEGGATVTHVRTGKPMRLAAPQQFMAREREAVGEAWPGDVIGVHDRGTLRIGDTLAADESRGAFLGIPRFPPEHFARVVPADAMRRKQLDTGLRQLSEEGAAQVFYAEGATGPAPIVGAVGMLQFDVMLHRLINEYGAPARLERLGFTHPRWVVGDPDEIDRVANQHGRMKLYDAKGHPLILFSDQWGLRSTMEREKMLQFFDAAP